MKPQITDEHRWLAQLQGNWTFESDCEMGPGQPNAKTSGKEVFRSLGDAWMIGEMEGEMPVGTDIAYARMTLGYNATTGRFVGTWVGSMMTHLWIYDGELDATRRILTLNAEGPSFAGDGSMAHYRDVIEIKSPDHRTLTSSVQQPDGTWHTFMRASYRRVGG
jgi:hypothetical protein